MRAWIEIPVYSTITGENIIRTVRVRPESIVMYGIESRPDTMYDECTFFSLSWTKYYTSLSLEELELLFGEKVKNLEQRQEELDNEARRNEMAATAERALWQATRTSWLDTRWSSGNEGTYRGSGQTFPTTEDPH